MARNVWALRRPEHHSEHRQETILSIVGTRGGPGCAKPGDSFRGDSAFDRDEGALADVEFVGQLALAEPALDPGTTKDVAEDFWGDNSSTSRGPRAYDFVITPLAVAWR